MVIYRVRGRMYLYGDVGYEEELNARSVLSDIEYLKSQGYTEVDIHLSSGGGYISEGINIFNIIQGSGLDVNIIVDGWAASVASVIALAGNKLIMPSNTFLMIHHAWSSVIGNAEELRNEADNLSKMNEFSEGVYLKKTGLSAEKLKDLMDKETYLTAQESLELGFCDEIIDPTEFKASSDKEIQGLKKAITGFNQSVKIVKQSGVEDLILNEKLLQKYKTERMEFDEKLKRLGINV